MAGTMELQHINVKIYVDGALAVDPARFIEVFHRWIQQKTLDELVIDVADYRHVPSGPGVVLIGHEADYSMDNTGNQWGLRYNRKAPLEGSNADRFRQALQSAARACRLLETELESAGPLRFSRQKFQLVVNDRALAPNTPETYATAKPQLEAFLSSLLGHGQFTLEHQDDPRSLFGVRVTSAKPFDLLAIGQAAS
jgi:hypothetical protein